MTRLVACTRMAPLVTLALALPLSAAEPPKQGLSFGTSTRATRGKYLVTIMGCSDCHTPMKMGSKGPEPDMSLFLAGHPSKVKLPPAPKLESTPWVWAGSATNTAFAGPWGTSYAPNLTSDPDTGIGAWTEENFVKALRTGKHLGVGRPIAPPMPWMAFGQATDEDLGALFAYLKTVPPVKNLAPEYQPPAAARR